MQMTSIDIYGPYPITKRQNRYLLTVIDHFSRYPRAIPIPSQDAETVARALVTQSVHAARLSSGTLVRSRYKFNVFTISGNVYIVANKELFILHLIQKCREK